MSNSKRISDVLTKYTLVLNNSLLLRSKKSTLNNVIVGFLLFQLFVQSNVLDVKQISASKMS